MSRGSLKTWKGWVTERFYRNIFWKEKAHPYWKSSMAYLLQWVKNLGGSLANENPLILQLCKAVELKIWGHWGYTQNTWMYRICRRQLLCAGAIASYLFVILDTALVPLSTLKGVSLSGCSRKIQVIQQWIIALKSKISTQRHTIVSQSTKNIHQK